MFTVNKLPNIGLNLFEFVCKRSEWARCWSKRHVQLACISSVANQTEIQNRSNRYGWNFICTCPKPYCHELWILISITLEYLNNTDNFLKWCQPISRIPATRYRTSENGHGQVKIHLKKVIISFKTFNLTGVYPFKTNISFAILSAWWISRLLTLALM